MSNLSEDGNKKHSYSVYTIDYMKETPWAQEQWNKLCILIIIILKKARIPLFITSDKHFKNCMKTEVIWASIFFKFFMYKYSMGEKFFKYENNRRLLQTWHVNSSLRLKIQNIILLFLEIFSEQPNINISASLNTFLLMIFILRKCSIIGDIGRSIAWRSGTG